MAQFLWIHDDINVRNDVVFDMEGNNRKRKLTRLCLIKKRLLKSYPLSLYYQYNVGREAHAALAHYALLWVHMC